MKFKAWNTVREIAHQLPSSIRIFDDLGIDYCCGGNKSIAQACHNAGVSLELLLGRLGELNERIPDPDFTPWHEAPLLELTRHIVETHHAYVREEIPRLNALLEKVNSRHGSVHPEITPMKLVFAFVGEDMLNHMQKEEQVLFPYINALERISGEGTLPPPTPFGSVTRPVECLMRDHEKAGKEMQQIRDLSCGYMVPEGACMSYRALYDGLRDFEQDLHRHVYLENNILFPRAIELESKACGRVAHPSCLLVATTKRWVPHPSRVSKGALSCRLVVMLRRAQAPAPSVAAILRRRRSPLHHHQLLSTKASAGKRSCARYLC